MLVRELMSSPPITAAPALSLLGAAHLLRSRGIRRLPVVQAGVLVGIITDRDIREAMPPRAAAPWESTSRLPRVTVACVGDVMRRQVLTTQAQADAKEAAHLMLTHKIGALPVLDEVGCLVGLVTVSDILRDYARPLVVPISATFQELTP